MTSFEATDRPMSTQLRYDATLLERRDLSPALAIFRIELDAQPDGPSFAPGWYKAGQYMVLGLQNTARDELGAVTRPLSLASAPDGRREVEFFVRRVEKPATENPLTHLLWALKPGDRLYAHPKPAGKFTLEHTVGRDEPRLKLLVSAGTGLAPFISILRDRILREPERGLQDFAVLRGASYDYELGYNELIQNWVQRYGLIDLPTISRPSACSNWKGQCGRVEDFFLPERRYALCASLSQTKLDPALTVVLICGLRGTIANTIERLLPMGFIPERRSIAKALGFDRKATPSIYFEQYDEEPVLDVRNPSEVERLRALLPPPTSNR